MTASLDGLEFVTATVELAFAVVGGSFNNNQHHQVWVTSTGRLNLTSSDSDATNSSDGSGDAPESTPLARDFVVIQPVNFNVGNPTLSHNWTMDDVSAAVVRHFPAQFPPIFTILSGTHVCIYRCRALPSPERTWNWPIWC